MIFSIKCNGRNKSMLFIHKQTHTAPLKMSSKAKGAKMIQQGFWLFVCACVCVCLRACGTLMDENMAGVLKMKGNTCLEEEQRDACWEMKASCVAVEIRFPAGRSTRWETHTHTPETKRSLCLLDLLSFLRCSLDDIQNSHTTSCNTSSSYLSVFRLNVWYLWTYCWGVSLRRRCRNLIKDVVVI